MICSKCKNKVEAGFTYCTFCGNNVFSEETRNEYFYKKDALGIVYTIAGAVVVLFSLISLVGLHSLPAVPNPINSSELQFSSNSNTLAAQEESIYYSIYHETNDLNNLLGGDAEDIGWLIVGATLLILGEVRSKVKARVPIGLNL